MGRRAPLGLLPFGCCVPMALQMCDAIPAASRRLSYARHPPTSASASSDYQRHGCALRLLRSRTRGLPLEHQDRGVVAEFVVPMLEDGMDEQAQHFRGALPGCGRPDDVVGEALQAELFACLVA